MHYSQYYSTLSALKNLFLGDTINFITLRIKNCHYEQKV
jgi:hypothetical protein